LTETDANQTLLTLTTDIVSAHVANNRVAVGDLAGLIRSVHSALTGLGGAADEPLAEPQAPAVTVRASIKPDYLVCLEDGKKLKMLKRYLMTNYKMTPADYRTKWKLPADYPMVAPNYAEQRRSLAHKIGLGRKRTSPAAAATPETAPVSAPESPKPRRKLGVKTAGDPGAKRSGRAPIA
jgi:predicted transcriptional regulator